MNRRRLQSAACMLASAAFVVLPAFTQAASAAPPVHDVQCASGSTADNPCRGTNRNDHIVGTPGDDYIVAGNGSDVVDAGDGNDTVYGGNGKDTLNGEGDNDSLLGGNGKDTINGGDGDDTIQGNNAPDTIDGGNGNDDINGGRGPDRITCGAGLDVSSDGKKGDCEASQSQREVFTGTVTTYVPLTTITVHPATGSDVTAGVTSDTTFPNGEPIVGDTVTMTTIPDGSGGRTAVSVVKQ